MTLGFEWDPRKGAVNLAKHRVSFEEAATVFGDPLRLIVRIPALRRGRTIRPARPLKA
ncbi:MAG: BrnT family toxin [Bryobacterales bacterium]|nr:BrnT family toxin [Bryobacterales bacterium]